MANSYGVRYLTVDEFVSYCEGLNVKTDKRELEYYEKADVMLPVARVIYPDDYVRFKTIQNLGTISGPSKQDIWSELVRLFDEPRILPQEYANFPDDELIDSFDREMGKNPYLTQPTLETYKSWASYKVQIFDQNGYWFTCPAVEHYYGYWQVHQLYYIQQYPDLYKNAALFDYIPDEIRQRISRPWAPSHDTLRKFKGLAQMFDMLSFWITVYDRERDRTFARIPEKHQIKQLDALQIQAYQARLKANVKLVQSYYPQMTIDDIYNFLHQSIRLYEDYRKKECYKLSEELRYDIIYQARLIETLCGSKWEAIAEELGKRDTFWTKQTFRHLNILTKERDDAYKLLTRHAEKYCDVLGGLKISGLTGSFQITEINELLDYCEREGFSILFTALSGMTASQDDYAKKFRRVNRYTSLKNVLTTVEFLLKDFAAKGSITGNISTLNPTIKSVLKNEAWMPLFNTKSCLTSAQTPADFFIKLNQLIQDPDLVQSEDTYWARVFLVVCLARNLTVHSYPDDDWFYAELFGEMLSAAIYAILYSWQTAKKEKWV